MCFAKTPPQVQKFTGFFFYKQLLLRAQLKTLRFQLLAPVCAVPIAMSCDLTFTVLSTVNSILLLRVYYSLLTGCDAL